MVGESQELVLFKSGKVGYFVSSWKIVQILILTVLLLSFFNDFVVFMTMIGVSDGLMFLLVLAHPCCPGQNPEP